MRSAIYDGVVYHRRHANDHTGGVAHAFEHHVTMPYLFLDELDEFLALHPLWSKRRRPVHFRRADYLGDSGTSLDSCVRDVVEARLGRRPSGPIAMLAHLRTWGWLFNPLTLYYCYEEDDVGIDAIVLEVTSTPWHERHVYVIDGTDHRARFAKEMHVSPFMAMDLDYVMSWAAPAERLAVHLGSRHNDTPVFDAGFTLSRRPATRGELGRLVWRRPLQTYGVSASIYRHAARLLSKRAPFHARQRPPRANEPATRVHS